MSSMISSTVSTLHLIQQLNQTNATTGPEAAAACTEDGSAATKIAKSIAYSMLLIFSLLGNCLVVETVYRDRRLCTTANFLIVSMSISDILSAAVGMPIRIQYIYIPSPEWLISGLLGNILCKGSMFIENTSVAVSTYCLLILAVERFHAIAFPLKPPLIPPTRTIYVLIGAWVIGGAFSAPTLVVQTITVGPYSKVHCYSIWGSSDVTHKRKTIYYFVYFMCIIALPAVLVSFFYCAIVFLLRRGQKRTLSLAFCERMRRNKENRRVALMSLAVVAVFFVGWGPYNVYYILAISVWNYDLPCNLQVFYFIADFLSYAYIPINPCIYYLFSKNYRQGFRTILGIQRCVRSSEVAPVAHEMRTVRGTSTRMSTVTRGGTTDL